MKKLELKDDWNDNHVFSDAEIDKDLMEAGFLCPDKKVHIFGPLSEWKGGARYMECKNCNKVTAAMAWSLT